MIYQNNFCDIGSFFFRLFIIAAFLNEFHTAAHYPVVVDAVDADNETVCLYLGIIAAFRDFIEERYDIAAECIVLVVRDIYADSLAHIGDRGSSGDIPFAAAEFFDEFLRLIVLVVIEITDEFLNEVCDCEYAAHSAVFVNNYSEVVSTFFLHIGEKSVCLHILVNEERFTDGIVHDRCTALVLKAEVILCIEYARYIVNALAAYRESGMACQDQENGVPRSGEWHVRIRRMTCQDQENSVSGPDEQRTRFRRMLCTGLVI